MLFIPMSQRLQILKANQEESHVRSHTFFEVLSGAEREACAERGSWLQTRLCLGLKRGNGFTFRQSIDVKESCL